ncbi:unnamed protein product, partial [Nesidiocoris tenuis]
MSPFALDRGQNYLETKAEKRARFTRRAERNNDIFQRESPLSPPPFASGSQGAREARSLLELY